MEPLTIAMPSIHSSPVGALGTADTGGMSVYIRELARELGGLGHRVDIFTVRRKDGRPAVQDLAPNVSLATMEIAPGRRLSKADLFSSDAAILAAIEGFRGSRERRYDLIHSHYWISGNVGRLARRRWQCPHVITFHTLGAVKSATGVGAAEPGRRLAVERALVEESDLLLAPWEGEKANLVHYYEADARRIAIVPGGVDLVRFRLLEKAEARERLHLDGQEKLLLTVGRLTPQKGQERIIGALAGLAPVDRPRLIIVGGDGENDAEEQRLRKLADHMGVASRVDFAGSIPQERLPDYYAAADLVVLASHYESFGLVGLEALACGRPVVTTPVGVLQQLARRRRPGVLIADNASRSLAVAIEAALAGASTWTPRAIRTTAEAFDWPRAAASTEAAYRKALQARSLDR